MEPSGFEPLTSCLQSRRTPNCTTAPLRIADSNMCKGLKIKCLFHLHSLILSALRIWAHLGSNQTPPRYQHGALPTELWALGLFNIYKKPLEGTLLLLKDF